MKLKTTKKEMQQYRRILQVEYCGLQGLLKYQEPFAYSCGVYGWNADYYDVDGVLIATGYRSMPDSKNVTCSYDLIREYDNKATGKTKEEIDILLHEFIKKLTGV